MNRKGAAPFIESVQSVPLAEPITNVDDAKRLHNHAWIIDTRNSKYYKEGHLPHSINLMQGEKFETWLGSLIQPHEKFYLAAGDEKSLREMIERAAAIGYETQIIEAFVLKYDAVKEQTLNVSEFKKHTQDYTIVDVRNTGEVKQEKIFENSLSFPLDTLRTNINKIPKDKPIVVHCASGYRSAAASSLLQSELNAKVKVYDLGEAVEDFL